MKKIAFLFFFGTLGLIQLCVLVVEDISLLKIRNDIKIVTAKIYEVKKESNHEYGTNWSYIAKFEDLKGDNYFVKKKYNTISDNYSIGDSVLIAFESSNLNNAVFYEDLSSPLRILEYIIYLSLLSMYVLVIYYYKKLKRNEN